MEGGWRLYGFGGSMRTCIELLRLTRSRPTLRYGVPVVLVGAALVLTRLASEAFGVRHYFVVLSAIFLSSLLGGRAAALVSALLGAVGAGYLFDRFSAGSNLSGLELAAFALAAVLLGVAGATISGLAVENARLLERARTALNRRDEILAIVSHDLRSPLNVISMSLANALRTAPNAGTREALHRSLEAASRAARQMERLIADLLDAAAIEEGKLSLLPHEEDVVGVLRDVFAAMRPLAEHKGIALRLDVGADLPAVSCDRDRVAQVLENLVANAIHATQAGTVTLQGSRVDENVCLEVRDTGPGIREDEIASLFDRYRRGSGAGYRGSGLGLYIAKGIVEAHGGSLRVDSRVGIGSTFSFSLSATTRTHTSARAP